MKLILLGMMFAGLAAQGPVGGGEDADAQPSKRVPPISADFEDCLNDIEELPYTAKVTLTFNVTPDGEVTDLRVIETTDSCFDKAALNAASRWEYDPKYVDGKKVGRTGVKTTMEFKFGGTSRATDEAAQQ